AVIIFSLFDRSTGSKVDVKKIVINILTNPLIVGAIAGSIFKFAGWQIPTSVMKPIGDFASMTTPISIFILGATLSLPDIGKNVNVIVTTIFLKLIAVPAFILVLMYMIGYRGPELFIAFSLYATPIAGASFPMAQNMGGDGELQGQLLAISTVLSLFTIFFWIMSLTAVGIF
ncbi:MAG: AEC family transporter, partial [Oribacterium sp.]|nr:AEC family transporter [Oribacterium sp.]